MIRLFHRAVISLMLAAFIVAAFTGLARACTGPAGSEGDMIYNYDYHVLQYCNGTAWVGGIGGPAGSPGPQGPQGPPGGTPAGSSGEVQYNNTGVFGAASNLFWDISNGSLGVGTSAPAVRLDVNGTLKVANGGEMCDAGYGGAIRYFGTSLDYCDGTAWTTLNTTGPVLAAGASTQIQFNSGGMLAASANFVWDIANGRLGVGTASPARKLDVDGAVRIYDQTAITGDTSLLIAAGAGQASPLLDVAGMIIVAPGGAIAINPLYGNDGKWEIPSASGFSLASDVGIKWSSTTASGGAKDIGLNRNAAGVLEVNNGAAGTYRDIQLRALNPVSGSVGIGNTSPAAKLDVAGTIRIADGGEPCGAATAGGIRYNGGLVQYCNGTSWANIGGAATDINSLTDGLTDYATDHNMRLGSDTAMTAGAANNLFIGESAGTAGTSNAADNNIAIGYQALDALTTGTNNVALGVQALGANADGGANAAIGYRALEANTSGIRNAAFGMHSMLANTLGSNNAAFGYRALENNLTGSGNAGLGYRALLLSTGNGNIAIGYQSGDALISGSSNIIIGYDIDAPSATASGQLSIGNLIFGVGINGTGTTISTGNVGIGTPSPQSTLHVPDGKYLQAEDNNAGAPPASDCDSDTERGRLSIDTVGHRLYVCNGAARGWDFADLAD